MDVHESLLGAHGFALGSRGFPFTFMGRSWAPIVTHGTHWLPWVSHGRKRAPWVLMGAHERTMRLLWHL